MTDDFNWQTRTFAWVRSFRADYQIDNFTLGLSPAFETVKSWSLRPNEVLSVNGTLVITRPTNTVRSLVIQLNAGRLGAGVATPRASPSVSGNGDGPVVQLNWVTGAVLGDVDLQLRDSAGSAADIIFEGLEVRRIVL